MILCDTGVINSYWRKPRPAQRHVFSQCATAFCGVTRAELYAGARSIDEIEQYSKDLSLLAEIPIEQTIWELTGHHLRTLRTKGIIVPFPDVVIAAVALKHDLEVWAYDAHYKMIQTAIPMLRLFQEP